MGPSFVKLNPAGKHFHKIIAARKTVMTKIIWEPEMGGWCSPSLELREDLKEEWELPAHLSLSR